MMENYFKRQVQLLGQSAQDDLKNKKIAIVGCGGLGCSIATALSGSGVGQIDLIDFDTVSIHNIHRQIALRLEDENKKKCKVVKEFIVSRNSEVIVDTYGMEFKTFVEIVNKNYDLILDATDNLFARVDIDGYCKKNNTPWIYGSVEKFHGQVCFFDKSNFEDVFKIAKMQPQGIAAPMVMNIASIQANIAFRFLANLESKKDYLYYCFFDNYGEYCVKNFNLSNC